MAGMGDSVQSGKAGCVEHATMHPLELIPIFRRWPWSPWRNVVYTAIWSVMIGAGFLMLGAAFEGRLPRTGQVYAYMVMSLLIGYAIHALYGLGQILGLETRALRQNFLWKVAYFAVIPVIGVFAGFAIFIWMFEARPGAWRLDIGWITSGAASSIVVSIMLATIFFMRERDALAQAELERQRLRAERVEREAVLANLRALQAQIEPHFLFNTLANVASLVDTEPARAKHMLESFNRFLRASLAATRGESTTLGEEAVLIAAYLDVLEVRMGSRLRYAIDVPPELAGQRLAPMLLQPVVENAIRHGLEPKVEGGDLRLAARRERDEIVVEVRDTGVGFGATTRGGVGLTNLRERLRGLYGERASLAIGDNAPAGTVVTVRLPA
jgi:sensor histidine kinase YesM